MASLKRVAQASLLTALLLGFGCDGQLLGSSDALPGGGGQGDNGGSGAGPGNGAGAAPGTGPGTPGDGPLAIGNVVMRRLNRTEYNNTVRDLLATDLRPADSFPTDDLGGGFPTVGSALSLSPNHVHRYESAAHDLVDDLFAAEVRREAVVSCDVEAEGEHCARGILEAFARRAWRRPVTESEVTSLLHPLTVAQESGATATDGLRHALAAVLMSPYFIFKVELSEDWIDPYELASRLSYAIWGTMPDDELFAAAESGELESEEAITAQVNRMLDDPRADALLDNFAARWLDYFDLENHEVDAVRFPTFSPELALSMKQEANRFVGELLDSSAPVPELLLARFTYVDELLSSHYGFSEPRPANTLPGEMWRVDTSSSTERGGLLTLGALLTSTSLSSRTSPVKRGDFIFSHMLCGKIPPPPPEVEGLPDTGEAEGLSLRERMELHMQDPSCINCHSVMDPLGFGLESYDAIGRYRTHDGEHLVDASGVLPGDIAFEGAFELAEILADDPRFPVCVTKHFMTYALGRIIGGSADDQWVEHLTAHAQETDGSLRSIIRTVVLSEPFRRRGSP